jgi:hypothetical protein
MALLIESDKFVRLPETDSSTTALIAWDVVRRTPVWRPEASPITDADFAVFADESADWAEVTFEAGAETWPKI